MTLLYPHWPPPSLDAFRRWCEASATTFKERRSGTPPSWAHTFWDLGFGDDPAAETRDADWVGVSFSPSAYVFPHQVSVLGTAPAAVTLHVAEPHTLPDVGGSAVLAVALAALDLMGGLAEVLEPSPTPPDAPGRLFAIDAGPDAYPPSRWSYFADAARLRWLSASASSTLFFDRPEE